MGEKWTGVEGSTEHYPLRTRAWCHQCREYCYPGTEEHHDGWCMCCWEADGYEILWVKRPPEEPATPQ
jgi:hypothetical protein